MTQHTQNFNEQMHFACEDAFPPYLRRALVQNTPERYAKIKRQLTEHMFFLANFCLRGYPTMGRLAAEYSWTGDLSDGLRGSEWNRFQPRTLDFAESVITLLTENGQ